MNMGSLLKWAWQGFPVPSGEESSTGAAALEEGDIIFSKNNVCLHHQRGSDRLHNPGYLSIQCQGQDLHLFWIPNQTLLCTPQAILTASRCSSPRSNRSACPSPSYFRRQQSIDDIHSYCCPSGPHSISSSCQPEDANSLVSLDGIDQKSIGRQSAYNDVIDSVFEDPNESSTPDTEIPRCGVAASNPDYALPASTSDLSKSPEEVTSNLDVPGCIDSGTSSQISDIQENSGSIGSCDKESGIDSGISSDKKSYSDASNSPDSEKGELEASSSNHELHSSQKSNNSVQDESCDSRESSQRVDESLTKENNYTKDVSSDSCATKSDNEQKILQNQDNGHEAASGVCKQSTKENELPSSPRPGSSCSEKKASGDSFVGPRAISIGSNFSFSPRKDDEDSSPASSYCSTPTRKISQPELFHVELGQVRTLRLFVNDEGSGQLVVGSAERQYKVMHFHHGGLEKLAERLRQLPNMMAREESDGKSLTFTVQRPTVTAQELHPEEGQYSSIDSAIWQSYIVDDGRIIESTYLRRAIFFGGIEDDLRGELWPFLLNVYPWDSTYEERDLILEQKRQQYEQIRKEREAINETQLESLCIIEKDVWRTDRNNPFFAGTDNPNAVMMKDILLDYAVFDPDVGYRQGMSDILAPVLERVEDPALAFWCLQGLLNQKIWVSSPTDLEMDQSLMYLRELLRILVPDFYQHIKKDPDGLDLLFCHRWLQLCMKREFSDAVAFRMWESCWAHYQTDYFHLLLCLAVISLYGDAVVKNKMSSDDTLLHFNTLQQNMDGELVLKKARGFLHQFRNLSQIPCTLSDLCTQCGPGLWDSQFLPIVTCEQDHGGIACPAMSGQALHFPPSAPSSPK